MMTPFKTVLVLLLFALPFSRSSSRDDAKVELRSVLKSTCVDWWPKRCKLKSQRQPKRFRNNCGKKNNQFGFCCKTQARSSLQKSWGETRFMGSKIPKKRENPQNFKHMGLFSVLRFSWRMHFKLKFSM